MDQENNNFNAQIKQDVTNLIDLHEQSLVRYAFSIIRNREIAREIVQDTFLKYLVVAIKPETPATKRAWLFRVCRNRAIDIIRKESKITTIANDFDLAVSHNNPERIAISQEINLQALQAIEKLPINQQEAIRLKFLNGFSYKEISSITGHSVSNVGFLIHAGLKQLRKSFKKAGIELE